MRILVLNCGSSSIKFQLIETDAEAIKSNSDRAVAKGSVERIGGESSTLRLTVPPDKVLTQTEEILDHQAALTKIIAALKRAEAIADVSQIQAVGHRVVHGGERFSSSMVIDDDVEKEIQRCEELAPLHNLHNLRGYYVARKVMPLVPQVAVFDTSFFHSLPPQAYLYGLPYTYYRRYKIRRYGFHGTSHRYVASRYAQISGKPLESINLITTHLGNGCSMAAIEAGKPVDTTMGFTPLEGLVMGTRCGDLDPAILPYLMAKDELSLRDTSALLNKFSGLYGISGQSSDMRDLLAAAQKGDEQATLAIDVFAYRIKKYIGAYTAALGRVDALVFTAGIGENAPLVREKACARLEESGFELDESRNHAVIGTEGDISADSSRVRIMVIPTNEELLIARDTYNALRSAG
jgi:acetate kinase